jgi:hypothetical protein
MNPSIDTNQASKPNVARVNPDELSLLIATRGRPKMLAEVFASLRDNTTRKDKTVMWLYVDDDDDVTLKAIAEGQFPDPGFPVHWHVAPQTPTLGEPHEALLKVSGRTSEIYMLAVDDARFDTRGWDEVIRAKFREYPDRILLAFACDPMTPDAATYAIMSRRWIEVQGRMFPGLFPHWYEDTWVDQIACLAGRHISLPVVLYPIGGKGTTKRMRNCAFWTRFLQVTLEERKDAARTLIGAMYPEDKARQTSALADMEKVATQLVQQKEAFSDIYCDFQEERHAELELDERTRFNELYLRSEAKAIGHLLIQAQALVNQKRHAEAMEFLDTIQYSDLRVRQAHLLKAECLRALGQTAEADRVTRECFVAWPRSKMTRRIFRFLGRVANDGKRLLVGLTAARRAQHETAQSK